MTARDITVWVRKDGTIVWRSENDGWAFLNSGPEAVETVITPEELKQRSAWLYQVYLDGPDHPEKSRRVYWTTEETP